MSNNNIEEMLRIYKMTLEVVFDYLVICKQYNEVEKLKNSKNSIPI
jgi:hypothetical protein